MRVFVTAFALTLALLLGHTAKKARAGVVCGQTAYLNHDAAWWHRRYLLTKRGKLRARATVQRHPVRFRRHGCPRSMSYGHGPEFWHHRIVVLVQRARRRVVSVGVRAAHVALHYIGTPYVWGGESPGGFDCSGLVRFAYRVVGVYLPRTTWEQENVGHRVYGRLHVGDILFFNGGEHEGMYIGGGRFVEAPHTGTVVGVRTLSSYGGFTTARRVAS